MNGIHAIFERSSEAVLIGSADGFIVNANAAAESLFGYGHGEMIGIGRSRLIQDPADLDARRDESGGFRGELRLLRKDGSAFDAEVWSVAFDTAEGRRLWVSVRDLSELRESEQRFRALSEATFEAVIVHDRGAILFANAAAYEMYRVPTFAGRTIFEFVAPESIDLVRAKSAAGDEGPYEAFGRRADGEKFVVEARARAFQFRGRPVRIVITRDISERRRLEASLAAQDRLATMGRLAAGVAHEVNNPLTFAMLNVEGLTRALSGKWPSEAERARLLDMLSQVQTGLDRVSRVVQDMRSFSRVEPRRATPVDLARVLDYATGVAGAEVRARAALRVDLDGPIYVRGDEARLGQVFVNLLVNAAHATPEGNPSEHRVDVSARRDGDFVEVVVRDTGAGIPESVRAHLFQPFHTTKAPGVGIGLGLSICEAIVTSLGGTIAADPPAERGTTFRVRLQAAPDRGPTSQPRRGTPRAAAGRLRVLVVDDEPMLRRALAHMLVNDCDVTAAASVDDALGLLERGAAFDAILCDIVMPGRNGLDFHSELALRFPKALQRLAFITGGVLDPRINDFLEANKSPRVYKPFSVEELLDTIQALAAD